MRVVVLLVPLLLGAVVCAVVVARVKVTARDVAWLAGTPHPAEDEAAVYARYLRRHREHRALGGTVGGVFALIVGLVWEQQIKVGIGDGTPLGDLLFCTLAGIVVGALLAETYRLAHPTGGAASLETRPLLPGGSQVRAARLVTGGAVVLGGGIALVTGTATPALMAGLTVVLVGSAEATRAAIRDRRRPALSDRAMTVDARMRAFAGRSVAHLELAAAVLGAGWTVSSAPWAGTAAEVARAVIVIAGLVLTIVLLRRAAPRPPRRWSPEPALA